MNELRLFQQLITLPSEQAALPPIECWNPPCKGEIDIRIAADGTWYHEGAAIHRLALVRLFASVLWREGEQYFLVTPVEKVQIQVEDAPLLVNSVDFSNKGEIPEIRFTTHVGDQFLLDELHPLRIVHSEQGEPRPYVTVRRNLEALLHRNVFYSLIDHALTCIEAGKTVFYLQSAGYRFDLGELGD